MTVGTGSKAWDQDRAVGWFGVAWRMEGEGREGAHGEADHVPAARSLSRFTLHPLCAREVSLCVADTSLGDGSTPGLSACPHRCPCAEHVEISAANADGAPDLSNQLLPVRLPLEVLTSSSESPGGNRNPWEFHCGSAG